MTLLVALEVLGLFAAVMSLATATIWIERRLLGLLQERYGPNRVGPFGVLQPLADVIKLVAKEQGWNAVPTGTRKSTYATPEFLKAAKFAEAEKKAIDTANPNDSTLPKSPYVGVQFAAIPEFQAIGVAVGQQISAALSGKVTIDQALKTSQTAAEREMRKAGYYK